MCLQGYDDHSEIRVEKIDGMAMVRKMATEVQMMMQDKIDAVKRIMEMAENLALDHKYDKVRHSRHSSAEFMHRICRCYKVRCETSCCAHMTLHLI